MISRTSQQQHLQQLLKKAKGAFKEFELALEEFNVAALNFKGQIIELTDRKKIEDIRKSLQSKKVIN